MLLNLLCDHPVVVVGGGEPPPTQHGQSDTHRAMTPPPPQGKAGQANKFFGPKTSEIS